MHRQCGPAFASRTGYSKPHGLAPIELYDTYVFNKTGKNPRAALLVVNAAGRPGVERTVVDELVALFVT